MTLRWEAFLDQVKERGEYSSRQEAERAARVVRAQLAARVPEDFALILLNPLALPVAPWRDPESLGSPLRPTSP